MRSKLSASITDNWRLIGAMEALIGFLMIGWSTAFSKANRLVPD